MNTSLDTVYLVSDTDNAVTLEIIIGATGQTATIDFDINGVHSSVEGSLPETMIGTNSELADKELLISCVISDSSPVSNVTEMIIRIRGGAAFREYHLSKIVEAENLSVQYTCLVQFKNIWL